MFSKEFFSTAIEIDSVVWTSKSMTLVWIQDVFHRNSFLLHREGNLIGFSLLYTRVVRTLSDQKRSLDVVNVVQRRNLLVEFFIGINIPNLLQHIVSHRAPVGRNGIKKCFNIGRSNDINSTFVNIRCESQPRQTSVTTIGTTVDANIFWIGDSLIDRPLNRIRQIVLHGPNTPFSVSLVKEILSISCRTTIVHLQSRITTVGKPLCRAVKSPVITRPWSPMNQQNQRGFLFGVRSRQITNKFKTISGFDLDIFHLRKLVVQQLGF
mmetsp:Transcript_13409/g.31572  ORF Transcript_13409/g.31572 Transcript_13409/m.31572 type:complete len:266 (-) Transcript_13409:1230-2027(-)